MADIKKQEVYYDKEQILASKRYSSDRDILATILDNKSVYKIDQVDIILENFKKKEGDLVGIRWWNIYNSKQGAARIIYKLCIGKKCKLSFI